MPESDYVTSEQLEEYVTWDQLNGNLREMATDLKGELVTRPVTVTVDLGLGATIWLTVLCLTVLLCAAARVNRGGD